MKKNFNISQAYILVQCVNIEANEIFFMMRLLDCKVVAHIGMSRKYAFEGPHHSVSQYITFGIVQSI